MYPSEANASAPRLNKDVATASVLAARTVGSVANLRAGERASLAASLNADPKFKKYTMQVERSLQTFDNVHEWADFIAFLTRLLKTFQSYMQFKEIPRKLTVAKRLSQCLNPALPTGVHQRALDVYAHILAVLGTEGLRRDLQLWSAGLFPFFEYAATSVKPTLLNLYDTHYLPLQEGLRPIMKAFILALLPGLEEETGEFFDKVLGLLDRLSGTVSPAFFFQNIWLVMLTTPSARQTALHFLSRRLPKLSGDEDVTSIIGRDIGLMIRAFAAALEDENLLVRRGALDLLEQTLPVDSKALKRAPEDDQRILMKVASNVVLRRDLSLNRRFFGWLLGPGPEEGQVFFFRANALDLLRNTLRDDMFSLSHSDSRPFKIFISLLDKWELGGPLVDVLLYDALKAVKRGVLQNEVASADLLMTGNALYDAVEPLAVWKQLFAAVRLELLTETPSTHFEAMTMVKFVLTRLRAQEEEVQRVHLPYFFMGLLNLMKTSVAADSANTLKEPLHEALQVLLEVSRHISPAALNQPFCPAETQEAMSGAEPYCRACKFFSVAIGDDDAVEGTQTPRSNLPFIIAFEDLVTLSMAFARNLGDSSDKRHRLAESFMSVLTLISTIVGNLGESIMTVTWEPTQWLNVVLATLTQTSFAVTDRVVSTVVTLGGSIGVQPRLFFDNRPTMAKMVNALFYFLGVDYAPYHARAVQLIWIFENATTHYHVESIIAQSLTSSESRNIHEAYEAFGVLWRLTDDTLLPGFRFKIPMLIVLDTLKNHDPNLRRIGETWMRCSLKSYTRVLEPLLYDLLEPSIRRIPFSATYNNYEIAGFTYENRFDQHRLDHILETLLSLAKFGGQGFGRIARSSQVRKSNHQGFLERVDAAGLVLQEVTYMDVLLEILLRFLQSEPQEILTPFMGPANAQIQANSIDLIQLMIARGDFDSPKLEAVQAVIVGKLFSSVHLNRVDLQNKLLHLLHSIISASSAITTDPHRSHLGSGKAAELTGAPEEAPISEDTTRPSTFVLVNPLLVQTLVDGITKAAGRPTLQHWLDFVLMTIPQYTRLLNYMVPPLSDCICRQLRRALGDVKHVLEHDSSRLGSVTSGTTDAEFIMLLNALERLVLLNLTKTFDSTGSEDEVIADRAIQESNSGGSGFLGRMFSSDTTGIPTEDFLSARSPGYRALHDAVRVLYSLWVLTGKLSNIKDIPEAETLSLIFTRARIRGRKVLERFFRAQSSEVMESIIECWHRGTVDIPDPDTAFEIVDALTSSAQTVVHMLCESISYRVTASDKAKKTAVNPNLSDGVIFVFLEEYLARLEGPLAVQVWGRCIALAKDITSNVHGYKLQIFPTLRCITVLADKVTQTTAADDRRTRKELQDTFIKLVDNSILIAGRSFDQGTWLRRSTRETLAANGRSSPLPPVSPETGDESSAPSLDSSTLSVGIDLPDQVNGFLASRVLPNLRRFLFDNDKVAGVCTNLVYYVITPAMKGKASGRVLDIDDCILETLRELAKIPPGAKAWRAPVSDAFSDNRFFNSTPEMSEKWRPIIRAFLDSDRQALPELIGKVTSVGSSNIFANREYETLLRSLNLRRLSYAVFTGEKNHFLTQLPLIQEKLVDILRNQNSPLMESEVYLCLRVLLCRLSAHNLSSFWPVILTELIRIFEQITTDPPPDGSEDLQVILSASKFLDLVIALQTEEFQIHQWMFVTDTVDAIYRPDAWFPEALLDQLAEIISDLPARESKSVDIDSLPKIQYSKLDSAISHHGNATVPMRRPLLSQVRQIESIRDLIPFFSNLSIASYEGVYHCAGNIDWTAIEDGLLDEMFEGRR
ncbi:hypothetical protein K439DRAFT_1629769 [Ramaria rubella]|nr:hypothetical protein K439DRAFT_1629769 [Ramaria rubella]